MKGRNGRVRYRSVDDLRHDDGVFFPIFKNETRDSVFHGWMGLLNNYGETIHTAFIPDNIKYLHLNQHTFIEL